MGNMYVGVGIALFYGVIKKQRGKKDIGTTLRVMKLGCIGNK